MRKLNEYGSVKQPKVNLAEFTSLFRKVHQLAAMKVRTGKEEEQFHSCLSKSKSLLQLIHPGQDRHIDRLICFSFQYYMGKVEEANDGNPQAAKIACDLKGLFQKELIALVFLN